MLKDKIHEIIYEARHLWRKSSKAQRTTAILFGLSTLLVACPSETVTQIGYGCATLFVLFFIFSIAQKGIDRDD